MVTHILFDWGGVLTQGKFASSLSRRIQERYGVGMERAASAVDDFLRAIETGNLATADAAALLGERLGLRLTQEEYLTLHRDAIVPEPATIEIASKLGKRFHLALASNNDTVTVGWIRELHPETLAPFEKLYFSHEMRVAKPDRSFFTAILEDLGIPARECLFIDDKEKNVAAAEASGMQAILYSNPSQLRGDLERRGIL